MYFFTQFKSSLFVITSKKEKKLRVCVMCMTSKHDNDSITTRKGNESDTSDGWGAGKGVVI